MLEELRTPGSIRDCVTLMVDNLPIQIGGFHDIIGNITAISPIIDIISNQTWNGSELIPEWVKKSRKPVDWHTAQTGETAKTLGRIIWKAVEGTKFETMAAPVFIEHLLNQYSGGMYKSISATAENVKDPSQIGAGNDLSTVPLIGTLFMRHGTSKLSQDFYDRLASLTQSYGSKSITVQELGELRAKQRTAGELSEIFERRRIVRADETKNRGAIKVESDEIIAEALGKIRKHNEATGDFRDQGIRSATTMLTDPGATESEIAFATEILKEIPIADAIEQLRRAMQLQGGSTRIRDAKGKLTPFGLRMYRLTYYL